MDVRDYSQKLNQVKERYQDAAKDMRTSADRENENIQKTADHKIKKQAAVYDTEKKEMEESAQKNNDYYTEKTRDTIAKRQDDYRKQLSSKTSTFDQEKNDLKKQYREKLSDVTNTYQTSANENNRLHSQSKDSMNERFLKTTGELQEDYNSKVNKFSEHAKNEIQNEKEVDHEQRKELTANYKDEIGDLRSKSQEKNFKEVARLSDDNEKLRTSFEREKDNLKEQKEARINDILSMKNEEASVGQKHFEDLRKTISAKESLDQEKTRLQNQKDAKNLDHKYNEDLKAIQRLSNQKIKGSGEVEGLKEDNKRLKSVYENRISSLNKNITEDTVKMNEKENRNINDTRDKLAALKFSYNEDREKIDRERDHETKKTIQKLTEKNTAAIDRYKDESVVQTKTSDDHLENTIKDSKNRFKDQRVEFGKVVNKINEKNLENISTLKDDFAKDRTDLVVKTQLDLSQEKRDLRDKLQQSLSAKDGLNQKKIEEIKKETSKISENYESKLEHMARQNEKEIAMIKASSEEKNIKQEQMANLTLALTKQEAQLDSKNLRNRYEKMIEKDRITSEQQTNRIVQTYEDQLERERLAHQKELTLRTNEAQAQFERFYRGSEIEKETIKSQYEDRIDHMKLTSLEQVNVKKA